jgi:hypothetical protein
MAESNSTLLKICTKCCISKPIEDFPLRRGIADGRKPRCKPCHNADNKEYRERNPASSRLSSKRWADANRERVQARTKEWAAKNKDHLRSLQAAWKQRNPEMVKANYKRQNDKRNGRVDYLIRKRISETIRKSLIDGKGGKKTFQLLGCTLQEFKRHLEKQFLPGMTWANIGDWQIDHIHPLANFRYETTECHDFKAAWSLSNLRPLWSRDNAKKGAKILHLI